MVPAKQALYRIPRKSGILPFINEDLGRCRKKWIVTKLINANLCEQNRNGNDRAKPDHVRAIHKIDEHGVNRPSGHGESKIAKVLTAQLSFLKKENQE